MNSFERILNHKGWLGLLPLAIILVGIAYFLNYLPNPLLLVGLICGGIIMAWFLIRPRAVILFLLLIRSSLDISKEFFHVYVTNEFQLTAPIVVSFILIIGGLFYIFSHRIPVLKIPFTKYLVIFLILSILNFLTAENLISSLMEFFRFFSAFIIYILAWTLFDTEKRIKALINMIILSSLIPLACGLYQIILNRGQFISGFIRAYGTFAHPNPYAFFLIIILALALNFYADRPRWKVKLKLLLLITLSAFCLLLTFTRTAWFGLFLLFIFLIWFRERRFIWPFVILLTVFVLLSPVRLRFYDLAGSFNSMVHRLYIWKAGLEKFPACPLIGRGLMSFELLDIYGEPAHNDLLRIIFELGIFGLIIYLALIVAIFRKLFAVLHSGLRPYFYSLTCAVFSIFVVFQIASITGNIFFRPAIQWYFWALVAAVLKGAEMKPEIPASGASGQNLK